MAFLIDAPAVGGGLEYVRQLSEGLSAADEGRVFCSSRGDCTARRVNAWNPDVIHVNHLRALVQLFACPWRRPKAPVVFVVHGIHLRKYDFLPHSSGNRLRRWLRRAAERSLYRKCAALVVLTEADRVAVHDLYGASRNVVRISNGVSARPCDGASAPMSGEPPFACLCIGRFDFQKGQDILLAAIARAADRLRTRHRRTLFIGDGKTLPELKRRAHADGLDDLVAFAGALPNAAALLSRGRVLVAPSRWEGLPFLLLEAGLRRKAVIASDCPGNRDVIADGVSGRLFPTGDAAALSALLMADWPEDVSARLGRGLERRVKADFAVEQMRAATFALWQRLVRGRREP